MHRFAWFCLFHGALAAAAQQTPIQINVDATGTNLPGDAANEPSLAVDPNDPLRLVAGWRQFDSVLSNDRRTAWAISTDGGQSWEFAGTLGAAVVQRSDPVLDVDRFGNFFYTALRFDGTSIRCESYRSADGGQSWDAPVQAFGGDKPWTVVDRSGSIGDGNVYMQWNISGSFGCCGDSTFTRSIDGGQSFERPLRISADPPRNGTLCVGADGTLYAAGHRQSNMSQFVLAKSFDARDPGATPSFQMHSFALGGAVRIFAGGGTPNPSGLLGQVYVVVHRGPGAYEGEIYVLASVNPPGPDPLDLHFVRSSDGGLSWSTPLRVNDDPTEGNAWQWFGTMDIAPDGRLDVIWYDTRDSGLANSSRLYHTQSHDGGRSWSPNQALSESFDSTIGYPNEDKLGDYIALRSDATGASAAFTATFHGEQDVYYLRIGDPVTPAPVAGTPARWLRGVAPNPAAGARRIAYALPAAAALRIDLYDLTGRRLRTLLDRRQEAGPAQLDWDGCDAAGRRVASGVYFVQLQSGAHREALKLVVRD